MQKYPIKDYMFYFSIILFVFDYIHENIMINPCDENINLLSND